MEDAFGFSWGFPRKAEPISAGRLLSLDPKGACAYRFFVQDAISFDKSLRVTIGFGKNEDPSYWRLYSKPENKLFFSSTAYWYQVEPHAPWPALPPAAERAVTTAKKP